MRILVDQNLSPEVAQLLRAIGYEAVHTDEMNKARTEDIDLMSLAIQERLIIATMDRDFHEMIATRGLHFPSTILIRTEVLAPAFLVELIHQSCMRYPSELRAGCLITANGRTIRVRSLPLMRK